MHEPTDQPLHRPSEPLAEHLDDPAGPADHSADHSDDDPADHSGDHLVRDLPVSRPTPPPAAGPGPLLGLRVIELAHPFGAFAGKLLADAGADVIVVEPPGGAEQRGHGPSAEGREGPEHSLAWWADNTSKRSVVADLDSDPELDAGAGAGAGVDLVRRLILSADVLLECEQPGRLAGLGLDHADLVGDNPDLIHVAITPFGRAGSGGIGPDHPVTDLTLLARGGPMWSCGYDDHALPPVRGRGDQGIRTAAHFAVLAVLTAVLARPRHGGQFLDVSMHAAANVTTEFASYTWLAAGETVQRQTGRHATVQPSEPTQFRCADGRYLNTGVPPRSGREFTALLGWLRELGLAEEFTLSAVLELGCDYDRITLSMLYEDPLAGEVFQAGREAMAFIAAHLSAHQAFVGFQQRGIPVGVVWSPDETLCDPHFVERGFPTQVHQPQIGRAVIHPGAPIRFTAGAMGIRHAAPTIGQHQAEVLAELDGADLGALRWGNRSPAGAGRLEGGGSTATR